VRTNTAQPAIEKPELDDASSVGGDTEYFSATDSRQSTPEPSETEITTTIHDVEIQSDEPSKRYIYELVETPALKDINAPPAREKRKSFYRPDLEHASVALSTSCKQLPIEPNHYKDAVKSKEYLKWNTAMKAELKSLHENETWELVALPAKRHAIGCLWVLQDESRRR
jgi:hypothetical protein